mgnify:CR=1 FL=1|jgi:hypothetical protein
MTFSKKVIFTPSAILDLKKNVFRHKIKSADKSKLIF